MFLSHKHHHHHCYHLVCVQSLYVNSKHNYYERTESPCLELQLPSKWCNLCIMMSRNADDFNRSNNDSVSNVFFENWRDKSLHQDELLHQQQFQYLLQKIQCKLQTWFQHLVNKKFSQHIVNYLVHLPDLVLCCQLRTKSMPLASFSWGCELHQFVITIAITIN